LNSYFKAIPGFFQFSRKVHISLVTSSLYNRRTKAKKTSVEWERGNIRAIFLCLKTEFVIINSHIKAWLITMITARVINEIECELPVLLSLLLLLPLLHLLYDLSYVSTEVNFASTMGGNSHK
jgi:hypothetical protein